MTVIISAANRVKSATLLVRTLEEVLSVLPRQLVGVATPRSKLNAATHVKSVAVVTTMLTVIPWLILPPIAQTPVSTHSSRASALSPVKLVRSLA